jgi:hypothetical protein
MTDLLPSNVTLNVDAPTNGAPLASTLVCSQTKTL